VIDPSGGAMRSAAVAPSGAVHVSYVKYVGTGLQIEPRYAACASACTTLAFDTPVLAVGADGTVHGARGGVIMGLRYLRCALSCTVATNWTTTVVDSAPQVPQSTTPLDLVADIGGGAHILYLVADTLKYASCAANCSTAANWATTPLADSGTVTGGSIAVSSSGAVHVVYFTLGSATLADSTNGEKPAEMAYTTCASGCSNPGGWQSTHLATVGVPLGALYALRPRIAVDGVGRIHVAYVNGGFHPSVIHSTCAVNCAASAWSTTTVDSASSTSADVSLASTAAHRVGLVYPSGVAAQLRYAVCDSACDNSSRWRIEILPAGVTWTAVLGFDAGGRPHAVFGDGSGELRYTP
jgi:hypothetical protein